MNMAVLQEFLFWCMILNIGIYFFSAIMMIVLRDFISNIHMKIFGLDAATVHKTFYNYLALYKLLIVVFNFVPWLALLIIKN